MKGRDITKLTKQEFPYTDNPVKLYGSSWQVSGARVGAV